MRKRRACSSFGSPRPRRLRSNVRDGALIGVPDASGRQTPQPIEGSSFTVDADMVIKALGFDPEDVPTMFGTSDLGVTRWGTLKIKYATMMTTLDDVFAVGDIVRGASLVVWAIRDGRDAAESIHGFLQAAVTGTHAGADISTLVRAS